MEYKDPGSVSYIQSTSVTSFELLDFYEKKNLLSEAFYSPESENRP